MKPESESRTIKSANRYKRASEAMGVLLIVAMFVPDNLADLGLSEAVQNWLVFLCGLVTVVLQRIQSSHMVGLRKITTEAVFEEE